LFRGRDFFLKFLNGGRKCELFFYLFIVVERKTPSTSWICFFFITDVRSCKERIGLAFRAFVEACFFFRTVAVDLFLLFESRDDDEVAYLVYVVRNDEVG